MASRKLTRDSRALAAHVVAGVIDGQSLNQVLPSALDAAEPQDRGLVQQLCYGTLRHAPRLIALLQLLLSKPLRRKDGDVKALLLVGLYQLAYTRIPAHAAVAATVEGTRHLKKNWASGVTNAVLRRFQREADNLSAAIDTAASDSHPQWLHQKIHQQWPDYADRVIAANNNAPPMTLRVNAAQIGRDTYLARLREGGIGAEPCAHSDVGITLHGACDVRELPGFSEGDVSVQDEAAQLAAPLIDARAGDRVLDACAAPGGKTCHILESQTQLAEMIAMDLETQRLTRIHENLKRLKLPAQVLQGDAVEPPSTLDKDSFDRILVDAPCSASGVIRRHPDVKVLRRPSDLDGFATQQLAILSGLWPLLKPGGRLVYATCSIFEEENDAVIARFTAQLPEAQSERFTARWGEATEYGRQMLPDPAAADGLYYALLTKVP